MKNIDKFIPLAKQYFYITLKNPVFNNNHFVIKLLKNGLIPICGTLGLEYLP